MTFGLKVESLPYTGGPARGRRGVWLSVRIGKRTLWINRHPAYQLTGRKKDARRLAEPRGPMVWRAGSFVTELPERSRYVIENPA